MTFSIPILAANAYPEWPWSVIILVGTFIPACFAAFKVYAKLEKPGLSPLDTDFKAFAVALIVFFATWLCLIYLLFALFK